MNYVLGIDVGGTKYHLRAKKENGRLVNLVLPSKGNLHLQGPKKMAIELDGAVKALKRKLRTRQSPSGVCIGMSGLDSPETMREVLRELSKKTWWRSVDPNRRHLVNDIRIGVRAGTDAQAVIAVISGTGSNGYAIDPQGEEATVSGRGMWMAGEGSGYEMGINCLRAVRRAEDGRGPATKLVEAVFKKYKVRSTEDMMSKLYAPGSGKRELAELNYVVEQVAEAGDKVARDIIANSAQEILLMVQTLHKRLRFGRMPVPVVFIGGMINNNAPLKRAVISGMRKMKWARPIFIDDAPVAGAIKMAE